MKQALQLDMKIRLLKKRLAEAERKKEREAVRDAKQDHQRIHLHK